VEALLGFDKSFGLFSVSAIVGGNQMYTTSSSRNLNSGRFNVPFKYFITNGKTQTFSDAFSEMQINSLFTSGDIGYKNYLYLSFTGRQDWFSTLSPESNSLFYPSVGISLIFSEAWKSKPSWLSYGKIRSSWAQVGGGAPNPYSLSKTYSAGSLTFEGRQLMTISGSTIPNALKPFTSTTVEAGIELRVLNDRIGVDFTVYDKKTTNDIVSASVSQASSFSSVRLNVGEMQNRGIELLFTGTPLRPSNRLNWKVGLNIAYNENTLTKIAEGINSLQGGRPRTLNAYIYHFEGQPYGMVAGYKMKTDNNGNIVYNNANGIPMQSSLMALGRGVPPLTMGFTNDFNYKNFSLGLLIEGKFGSVMYSSTNAYGTYYGKDLRTVENNVRETGVSVSGVDQNGSEYSETIPAEDYFKGIGFSITDEFIYDASFVKFRELSLGYNIQSNLFNQRIFQSAYLSLVARNPFIIYRKVKDVDPESSYSVDGNSYGLENFGVLPTRSWGVNLAIKF
jgi:outer membrane receptor protein involved in Fe transport